MKKEKIDIDKLIYQETKERLEEMESPDYEFPKTIGKIDVAIMVTASAISLVLIVLCMTGVIS